MTICATETPSRSGGRAGSERCTVSADGGYAARLTAPAGDDRWYPERWTLAGPEPYTVALPGNQPEEPDSQLLPLADGRVLIVRRADRLHRLSLLYPSGPRTGECPLGTVESACLTLLPPAPDGRSGFALATGPERSTVWRVAGGARGPEPVAEVTGHCSGGAWLDREGRLLALDRRQPDGPTKTVVVDLGRGGEVSPLLQLTEDSEDRLLLADPDSGLILVRSDAPGEQRTGWGVLGSSRPVHFPSVLHPAGVELTPFAVQPAQMLTPEGCLVAFRVDGPNGTWAAVWRPAQRELLHLSAPAGWLPGVGLVTAEGELRLPCSGPADRCGMARFSPPRLQDLAPAPPAVSGHTPPADAGLDPVPPGVGGPPAAGPAPTSAPDPAAGAGAAPAAAAAPVNRTEGGAPAGAPARDADDGGHIGDRPGDPPREQDDPPDPWRPVPLQEAPLAPGAPLVPGG